MKKFHFFPVLGIILTAMLAVPASAQTWTYPGCADVTPNDFKKVTLVDAFGVRNDPDMLEPLKLAFDMDEVGNVDIYYIRRHGSVNHFDAVSGDVTEIGRLNPRTGNEDGLVGIVLDPDFKTTGWIFLMYSHDQTFRISRFEYDAGEKSLDLNSEIVLVDIPSGRDRWHSGGGMAFDDYGDLWVTVGDNEAMERGPANTADLRGGIIRIHPNPDGTYSIPKGNMWEFASQYFAAAGESDLADEYRDENKVSREVWSKGTRNAYTLTLDPVRRWATYGDCGPDRTDPNNGNNVSEEHTVVTEPSFLGWPYWTGTDCLHSGIAGSYDEPNERNWDWNSKKQNRPENLNPNKQGVDILLPHKSATHPYPHQCAMTGPIYRYDPSLESDIKFPPHFHRVWFVTDFNQGWINALALSPDGQESTRIERMWNNWSDLPLDMQMGPDGALYSVNYSCGSWRQLNQCTSISRIEYTGPDCDAAPGFTVERAGCTNPMYAEYDASIPAEYSDSSACITHISEVQIAGPAGGIVIEGLRISITASGEHTVTITDVRGKHVFSAGGSGNKTYAVPAAERSGIHLVRVRTPGRSLVRRLMLY